MINISPANNPRYTITVFTATYNRGKFLPTIYKSLLEQDFENFEWLIVDDGSSDNTTEVVQALINHEKIRITYVKQANGGKHSAINRGVQLSQGELFFMLDSDDSLPSDSLSTISHYWDTVKSDGLAQSFAGVSGNKNYSNGKVIGGDIDWDVLDANVHDFRHKFKIKGDKAEAYRTEVLAQYPFPVISDEKFCTESLIWNRIGKKYKLRNFNKSIYIADYLEGGLSDRSMAIRASSPRYTSLVYSEMVNESGFPIKTRIRAAINFWRFSPYNKSINFGEKVAMLKPFWSVFVHPIGFLLFLKEREAIRKK